MHACYEQNLPDENGLLNDSDSYMGEFIIVDQYGNQRRLASSVRGEMKAQTGTGILLVQIVSMQLGIYKCMHLYSKDYLPSERFSFIKVHLRYQIIL